MSPDHTKSAQQSVGADLAFGSVSSLALSSSLNQVQWLVVSSWPSRPSGSTAGVGRIEEPAETVACQRRLFV
jgi:hypothetical protein